MTCLRAKFPIAQFTFGGVAGSPRVAVSLALAFQRDGHRSFVLFWRASDKGAPFLSEALDAAGVPWGDSRKTWLLPSLFSAAKLLAAEKPELVFIHGARNILIVPFLKVMLPGAKICVVHHGPVGEIGANRVLRLLTAWSWLLVKAEICVGSELCEAIKALRSKTSQVPVIIPNGVDVESFNNVSSILLRRGADAIPVLCMAAVFSAQKDQITLVKAASILLSCGRRLKLRLPGDGPLLGSAREFASLLGIEADVEFPGALDSEAVKELLSGADIYVQSTHSEGMSISMLEAMSSGLPLVCSDCKGMDEFVKAGAALKRFTPGVPEELAARIAEFLDSPDSAREAGAINRRVAEKTFSLSAMAAAYENLAAGLLNKSQ
ncbi:MAG: hypothetical protein A2X49_14320 [Lentisphaerae bacterium GWF2_52_8]|nr:MAG: hypothetical protein A2X49_14320 [Lentisphaerae bacterium GWF2_52_8]